MRERLRTRKLYMTTWSNMLGVGTAGGARRCVKVFSRRLLAFRSKMPRIQALRGAGVNTEQVVRAVGAPAYFYGVDCCGVADLKLEQARRAHVLAVGTRHAGNLDALLNRGRSRESFGPRL